MYTKKRAPTDEELIDALRSDPELEEATTLLCERLIKSDYTREVWESFIDRIEYLKMFHESNYIEIEEEGLDHE